MRMKLKVELLLLVLAFAIPLQAQKNEWRKLRYEIATDVTVSTGEHAPFWLVSNRHGMSSLKNNSATLSAGLFRDFDKKKGFTWAYGVELAGAWNHYSPFYVQQLYADVKYNCWELSIGSKERWSENKHRTLSGGGLTFSSNARPIPQVRFGINEYTTAKWLFNGWLHVKGHLSYGWQSDGNFQRKHMENAGTGSLYVDKVLFHEKSAFVRIGKQSRFPLTVEMGLEMYTQFGGRVWKKSAEGDVLLHDLPHTYREYLKALIPMAGGSKSTEMDQTNINGNVFGSWHLAFDYSIDDWKIRAYYEHYFEDHSGMLGFDYHYNRDGKKQMITYLPWRDFLVGFELALPNNRVMDSFVYEFITSRDQSGPILQNPSGDMLGQAGGKDWYYTHSYYQSWQHWGMAMCNPHTLSPLYNKKPNMTMPYSRIQSHHIGFDGTPCETIHYRVMSSWTKHWGSYEDPLPDPLSQLSVMGEVTFVPKCRNGWKFTGAIAYDHSRLIGNNFGAMLTICKSGWLSNK